MISSTLIEQDEPITLNSLANFSEKLVEFKGRHLTLKNDNWALKECNCDRLYDRTYHKPVLKKHEANIPKGFKSPLDFFESVTAKYIVNQLIDVPEIHFISLGSGYLLRELFIIAKCFNLLQIQHPKEENKKIVLHAVDHLYKKTEDLTKKSTAEICHEQFNGLIKKLNMNVDLKIHESLDEYNEHRLKNKILFPEIMLAIDFPQAYERNFPEVSQDKSPLKNDYQEGFVSDTQEILQNGSYYITLSHMDLNGGLYIIFEKKSNNSWEKIWVHTILGSNKPNLTPPAEIQQILNEKGYAYASSQLFQMEQDRKQRFKNAKLSLAVKENNRKKIQFLIENSTAEMINAASTDGFTALHWAAIGRRDELIKKLIEKGADIHIQNYYGHTAFDYYFHKITLDDFKNKISDQYYQYLFKNFPEVGKETMAELNEAYSYFDDIFFALSTRNNYINYDILKLLNINKDMNEMMEVKSMLPQMASKLEPCSNNLINSEKSNAKNGSTVNPSSQTHLKNDKPIVTKIKYNTRRNPRNRSIFLEASIFNDKIRATRCGTHQSTVNQHCLILENFDPQPRDKKPHLPLTNPHMK